MIFLGSFWLVFPRHPWRGKSQSWNHRSILSIEEEKIDTQDLA